MSALKPHRLLLILLALQAMIGLGYTATVPLWQGHEQDFYTVIRFLTNEQRLPSPADYPAGDADVRQATQPPLYFLVAAPVVALLDDHEPVPPGIHPNNVCVGGVSNAALYPYVTTEAYNTPVSGSVVGGYALRVLNVVIGLIAVTFTYLAGRALFPAHPSIALMGAALLAFEPSSLQWSATINNDTLLLAIAAANLWLCARLITRLEWRTVLLILLTAVLALITRLPGWAVVALDVLVLVAVFGRLLLHKPTRGQVRFVLLSLGLLALAIGGFAVFNYSQYGNLLGRYSYIDRLVVETLRNFQLPWVTFVSIIDHTRLSYIAPFQTILPREMPVLLYSWLLLVGVIGSLWGVIRAITTGRVGGWLLLLAAALLAVALVIVRNMIAANDSNTTVYNTAFIYAPLRYYTPGLPAFALLFSAGLFSLVSSLSRRLDAYNPLAAGVALIWLIVSVVGIGYLVVNRPPNPVMSPAELARIEGIQLVNRASPDGEPQLWGYTWSERPDAGMVDVTLYLTTNRNLTSNYMARVEMVTDNGQIINACEFLPTRGIYPPPRWLPSEIVVAQASIPNCNESFAPPLTMRLNWLRATMQGELQSTDSPQPYTLGTLSQPLSLASTCPPNLGRIAGGYQIIQLNSPSEVRREEAYVPSLNWLVIEESPDVIARIYVFRHRETGVEYPCNNTTHWADLWRRGETVFFDQCTIRFPADAPLGDYAIQVGLQDGAAQWLPAVDAAGQATTLVEVGAVRVVE